MESRSSDSAMIRFRWWLRSSDSNLLFGGDHEASSPVFDSLRLEHCRYARKSGEDRDEAAGQVFVEFDLHRLIGVSIRGMSSCAEPAANAMAARTSSSDNVRKSARISAVVAPSARLALLDHSVPSSG